MRLQVTRGGARHALPVATSRVAEEVRAWVCTEWGRWDAAHMPFAVSILGTSAWRVLSFTLEVLNGF